MVFAPIVQLFWKQVRQSRLILGSPLQIRILSLQFTTCGWNVEPTRSSIERSWALCRHGSFVMHYKLQHGNLLYLLLYLDILSSNKSSPFSLLFTGCYQLNCKIPPSADSVKCRLFWVMEKRTNMKHGKKWPILFSLASFFLIVEFYTQAANQQSTLLSFVLYWFPLFVLVTCTLLVTFFVLVTDFTVDFL